MSQGPDPSERLQQQQWLDSDHETPPELDGQIARISISHDGEYATAVCLAAEDPHHAGTRT